MKRLPRPARTLIKLLSLSALMGASVAMAAPAPAPAMKPAAPTSDAAPITAPAAMPASTPPTAASLKPALPMDFSAFAADYQATNISPPWLTIQAGILETFYAPPLNKTSFIMSELRPDLAANYHPIEISSLVGAKARYDNVTLLDLDKVGHPLGYTLPLGQILYFVARDESPQGVIYSIHYYDSGKDLRWAINPEKPDSYIPVTNPVMVTQDLNAPMESYTFLYLSQRTGPQRPDSTARPVTLYTYLVVHLHRNASPAASTGIVGR